MSETRYSMQTASEYLNISIAKINYRAQKLGIITKRGLTAADIRRMDAFGRDFPERKARGTLEELKKEMEAFTNE